MKKFFFIGVLACLFSLSASTYAATSLNDCDQKLIQASKACKNADKTDEREECIMEHLADTECQLEVIKDENVDICEECKPVY
jgi:hypothetical protein